MDCWHHEIDKARTEEDVVRSASDYLMLWAPRGLAGLLADGRAAVHRRRRTRSPVTPPDQPPMATTSPTAAPEPSEVAR